MKILPNTIIYFHEILDQQQFTKIIESLIRNYNIIGLTELEHYYYKNKTIKNCCHITFDDGDISFYNHAFPIIKKFNIPVSLYVSPLVALERKNFWFQEIRGYDPIKLIEIIEIVSNNKIKDIKISEPKDYLKALPINVILEIIKMYQMETKAQSKQFMNMNENQLIEVYSSGLVDIGAHTLNHPKLVNENNEIAYYEISKSIDQLSDLLNSQIKCFVYPNGDYGEREISILRSKGIKLAFSTERGELSNYNNPLSIPRSGSPIISDLFSNKAYKYSKILFQLMAGQKKYYKYADTWNSFVSKLN